jgi:two-component system sensor histidine kinase CpxA
MRMPVVHGVNGEELFTVLVLTSNSFFLNPFFFEARSWLGLGAAALLISVACWLPLMRNVTRSVTDMMRATGRIADGSFDVQVNSERHDELGRLGSSIKQMANRLERYTAGRTRFLGSVAHELRSPVARMQLAAEILERNSGSENRKYIDYLKEDIETMSRLTDELLQVARAESSPGPVKVHPLPITEVVEDAVQREASEDCDIQVDIDPSLIVLANPDYLARALGNIVRNAVRYAAQHGPIAISAERRHNEVAITIADSGPGVPDADLDRIFMPFYRVDDARDRRTGGTGLGLAIVRSCIEACGGKVTAQNRRPSGLQIVITLTTA